MEEILKVLKDLRIDIFNIEETETETAESFFIRKNLDLKRSTRTRGWKVTVFKAFEKNGQKMLGSSTVQIHPGMSAEEIVSALEKAFFAAGLVSNPYYELPAGQKEEPIPAAGGFAGKSLEDSLVLMAEALFTEDNQEDVFINSAEFFMRRTDRRIVNSSGIDVAYRSYDIWGEYVVQCIVPQDVETYHQFSYREPETGALRLAVAEALEMTRARSQAMSAPETGEYALILSGKHVSELLNYYVGRSSAAAVYQKYSNFQVGAQVQGGDLQGDALSIDLKAREPYSAEGIAMKDRPLMEDGVLNTLHSGARFAWYLGIEPTGSYGCISVPTGTAPLKELKSGKYLHVLSFSDFQMNIFSGHFGGEIRLALLCDREGVRPVTGGSINGNILQAQKQLRFSQERFASANYEGPLAVRIEGVKVAGA